MILLLFWFICGLIRRNHSFAEKGRKTPAFFRKFTHFLVRKF